MVHEPWRRKERDSVGRLETMTHFTARGFSIFSIRTFNSQRGLRALKQHSDRVSSPVCWQIRSGWFRTFACTLQPCKARRGSLDNATCYQVLANLAPAEVSQSSSSLVHRSSFDSYLLACPTYYTLSKQDDKQMSCDTPKMSNELCWNAYHMNCRLSANHIL